MSEPPRGFVHVVVHCARELPAADINFLDKPSSDPFCVLSLGSEKRQTTTVNANLNPIWEEAFSFTVGGPVRTFMHLLLGLPRKERPGAPAERPRLGIGVWDADVLTAADPLGSVDVDLAPMLGSPCVLHKRELPLRAMDGGSGSCGRISISVVFEPAPKISQYGLRIVAVACFAVAGAMFLIGTQCRWQSSGLEGEAAKKQPGVGAALALGAACSFVGCALNFLFAHMPTVFLDEEELLAQFTSQTRIGESLGVADAGGDPGALKVKLLRSGLTNFALSITPSCQLALPLLVVARLVIVGAMGMAAFALLLQAQHWNLTFEVGELLDLVALLSLLAGLLVQQSTKRQETAMSVVGVNCHSFALARRSGTMATALAGVLARMQPQQQPLPPETVAMQGLAGTTALASLQHLLQQALVLFGFMTNGVWGLLLRLRSFAASRYEGRPCEEPLLST